MIVANLAEMALATTTLARLRHMMKALASVFQKGLVQLFKFDIN